MTAVNDNKPRVLSGIQPSGNLTIGNYLGALKQWVEVQHDYDCFYCVVDLHAITMPQDPVELRQRTRESAAMYIAAGIDPEISTIFVQSHVPAHSELAWMLTCMAPLGWLHRMTQFKDRTAKQTQESIGAGLLNYPSLMAADILLYHADLVPVGDDQNQHLEFTRDLAQRFNHLYGDTFTLPSVMNPQAGARIMGLDNPTAKMSKSEASENHAIFLLDELPRARKKIMRAVTDSQREIRFSDEPERAGVNNLLTIYQAISGESNAAIEAHFADKGYGDLKRAAADCVLSTLEPLQARYYELMNEAGYLDSVLRLGREKASAIADETLKLAQERMGFLAPS
ncbi:MAG: tryptophan--tRNA ligase [Chloroflexota bacterium]|nr:tryptophan--tRNA ligase [Chloroflexota bacterium]MDE2855028.1 tryptophan--tRNA ligase [Chloroflexota bacterium]MDE2946300.1 tryptophan--tRNA ligase [Chloroflexota bacterium]